MVRLLQQRGSESFLPGISSRLSSNGLRHSATNRKIGGSSPSRRKAKSIPDNDDAFRVNAFISRSLVKLVAQMVKAPAGRKPEDVGSSPTQFIKQYKCL